MQQQEKEFQDTKKMEAEVARMNELLREKEAELSDVRGTLGQREGQIRDLLVQNKEKNDKIKQMKAELPQAQTMQQQANQLLQARSEKLPTAQAFLKKSDYYLQDIIFQVENELFKVPRLLFVRHSEVFRDMFNFPAPDGVKPQGSSDQTPLVLHGIETRDFTQLLRCLYPSEFRGLKFSFEEWQSVLKLASLYQMAEVKDFVVENMTPLLEGESPSLKIHFAKEYEVQKWLEPGITGLVERSDPIDEEDVKLIGVAEALKVCRLREARRISGSPSTGQQILAKADNSLTVARLVETLNADVSQASMFISDSLSCQKLSHSKQYDKDGVDALLAELEEFLGKWLCDILWERMNNPNINVDPLITQIALQAGLINACDSLINGWEIAFEGNASILNHIYSNMGASEGQVIAGRWRALTHTHIDGPGLGREKGGKCLRKVVRKLLAVITGSMQNRDSTLPPHYKEKVDGITEKVVQLRKLIGREVTSMDLSTYIISCGTQFNPAQMEDEDRKSNAGTGRAQSRGPVLCTLEMGLRYRKSVPSSRPGRHQNESGVILKAKVVLTDVFGIGEATH